MKFLLCLSSVLAISASGCGKKSEPAPGAGTAKPTPTEVAAPKAAPADPPKAPAATDKKPAKISKQTRAEYKRHLQAGRKLAQATKWPEALAELEAALAAIPGDDRALAELSYAYMASGNHEQARKAGRAAVLAATDPKVKAAALYNLGRVEEGSAPAKAAAFYQESLALRPNKTVEKRLADLASNLAAPSAPACATPMPEAELCTCLRKKVADMFEGGAVSDCELEATAVTGWKLARYATSDLNEYEVDVVAQGPAGWAVVGELANIYNPGAFGIAEDWTLDRVHEEALGDHMVVRFESSKSRQDSDLGIDEVETEDSKHLLVCVRDPKGGLPTCPLDVTTSYSYLRDRLGLAEAGDLDDVSDMQTPGLPIKSETKLSVALGADGVAQVRVERGRADSTAIGDRRLW